MFVDQGLHSVGRNPSSRWTLNSSLDAPQTAFTLIRGEDFVVRIYFRDGTVVSINGLPACKGQALISHDILTVNMLKPVAYLLVYSPEALIRQTEVAEARGI
jgi:hypothetical protein